MKKSIVYLGLLAVIAVYLAGCTQNPQGNEPQVTRVSASDYISRNDVKVGELNNEAGAIIMRTSLGARVTSNEIITPDMIHAGLEPSHVRGARIYDDFTIELAATVPGPNPLLAIVNTGATPVDPALSAADSWRCSQCHGFDYEGGVYEFNNGATNNLLELQDVRGRDEDFVRHMLMIGFDAWDPVAGATINVHNYTGLLPGQALVDVSDFVVNEIFDTHIYIRAPTSGGLGDHVAGDDFYNGVDPGVGMIPDVIRVTGANFNCVDCHGTDGLMVAGIDLYTLAWTEPFKWLHRVNFGSPRDLATYPDVTAEDAMVHPGLYEVILTKGLHFGGPTQAGELMAYSQEGGHLTPAP